MSMNHGHYLGLALEQAEFCVGEGALPVGAVIVAADGALISAGRNAVIPRRDLTAHAEIEAIRNAGNLLALDSSRGSVALYTSAEPCLMCLGAIVAVPSITSLVWATASIYASAYTALVSAGFMQNRMAELAVIGEPSEAHRKRSRALLKQFYLHHSDFERAKLLG
jgi:tRNA(adenine34) deaminase